MSTETEDRRDRRPVGRGRRKSTVLPSGYSWLSVPIPTEGLDNLHVHARQSGMTFEEYMGRFCFEALPYPRNAGDHRPEHAPETVSQPGPPNG